MMPGLAEPRCRPKAHDVEAAVRSDRMLPERATCGAPMTSREAPCRSCSSQSALDPRHGAVGALGAQPQPCKAPYHGLLNRLVHSVCVRKQYEVYPGNYSGYSRRVGVKKSKKTALRIRPLNLFVVQYIKSRHDGTAPCLHIAVSCTPTPDP